MSKRMVPKKSLKVTQVAAFRMRRHHLAGDHPSDVSKVSRDVCGIQAQVMSAAELALWVRCKGLARSDVRRALWENRTLIKTSGMRGTLHLLSSADFPIYIRALERSRVRQTLQIMSRYGVSEKEAYGVMDVVVAELASGPLTRRELNERVLGHGIVSKKAWRWFEGGAWGVARLPQIHGSVCYGPGRNNEVSFVRVDQWLPRQKQISEDAARQELLRRYLRAYEPATPKDFARWAGFSMPDAKTIWESLRDDLEEVDVEGRTTFILRRDGDEFFEGAGSRGVLRLLPNFDPFLLAHAEKDHIVAGRFCKRVYRPQWWISPVVLLDGRAVGTWSYARRGKRLQVQVAPFEKFSKAMRDKIEEQASRLGKFLEASADMEIGN
jgi:winged helix DNA-binding protein